MTTPNSVLVIGAGVVGSSITYHLSLSGIPVTLLDRNAPGSRSSWVSFAYINALNKRPDHYHKFSRLGVEAYSSLEEDLGPDAGLGRGGALHWPAPGPDGAADIAARAKEATRLNYPIELLTLKEAAELEPSVHVGGADGPVLYAPQERWADGDLLARTLTQRASEHGANVITPCTVSEIVTRNGRVVGVASSKGFMPADTVVVAAGAASVGLLAPLGYRLPLNRDVGILVVVSADAGLVRRVLYLGEYHVRPTANGRIAIGCRAMDSLADDDTDTSTPPSWTGRLLDMAKRDIRGLGNAHVDEFRVGPRPVPGDGLPVIGPVPGVEGAYLAVMHSGVTLAAIVGQTVAKEFASGETDPILEPYRPDRFASPTAGGS